MSRLLLLAGLLLARPAWATNAAFITTGVCGALDTTGQTFVLGALKQTRTQSTMGTVVWTCDAQCQGTGQAIRYTPALYGPCGTEDGLSFRWLETISASGRVHITCTVKLGDQP